MMGYKARFAGVGYAVPDNVVTNADLEKSVATNDEWIRSRTGIEERRIAPPEMTSSQLGTLAARTAIEQAGVDPLDIDLIMVATITPDMVFPATACLIQHELGARNAGTMDLEAACSGFIYGLSVARAYIRSGEYRHVLVVAAETLSKITDWEDRGTCILFGDGAGAVLLSAVEDGDSDIIDCDLGGDGALAGLLYLPAGGSLKPASAETVANREHYMRMNGREVFKAAVNTMQGSVQKVLQRSGVAASDLALVIPHQANLRIIESLRKSLDLVPEKVYVNVQKYGNTSAASIAIALAEAVQKGLVKRGDLVVLCAFGGGLTWATALLRF
jgi:3-oxoacyl-[acyl-carrier-protein] synthase-3